MQEKGSYKNIAKTSGIVGLVQVAKILFGIINTKILAVFVGPLGYGIYSMYQSLITTASSFASLGVNQSGVRDIAQNASNIDAVNKCIWIFRRLVLVTSVIVSVTCIIFSKLISVSLFKTEDYYIGVSIVSITVLLDAISKGQIAILNGFRNIRYLAFSQILGIVLGSVATVFLVLLFREQGIPYYILAVSVFSFLLTWWFVRKLKVHSVRPSNTEIKQGASSLLKTGLGFCVTGMSFGLITYISRSYLSYIFGLSSVGVYMASWTLSNLYIGLILSSMGVDFMPRIMAKINDNASLNEDINQQMEFGVLFTGVGIVGIIIFASAVLAIFYSEQFLAAQTIIRWQVLGVALRVLAYPLGYVLMGKNKVVTYITVQIGFYILEFCLLVLASKIWGFNGLGLNYFIGYVVYCSVLFVIMKRMIGFKISPLLLRLLIIEWTFIVAAFILSLILNGIYLWCIGGLLAVVMLYYTNSMLKRVMSIDLIGFITRKLKRNE